MKDWKKLMISVVLMIGLAGCATMSRDQRINQLSTAVELAAFTGTSLYLQKHPQATNHFTLSRDLLSGLIKDERYDPASLANAVKELPIKELQGEQGAIIVTSALILYENYIRGLTDLEKTPVVKAVATSLRDGISRAIGGDSGG